MRRRCVLSSALKALFRSTPCNRVRVRVYVYRCADARMNAMEWVYIFLKEQQVPFRVLRMA